jgi:hypothetical protein
MSTRKYAKMICKRAYSRKSGFNDMKKDKLIDLVLTRYKEVYKEEWLDWLSNDLLMLIGFKIVISTDGVKNDTEGLTIWNELDKYINPKKRTNEKRVVSILSELPNIVVLSLLGYQYTS